MRLMSLLCGELRSGRIKTSFENVKAFINREDVDCNNCSISNTSLENIRVDISAIKGKFNAGMSKTLVNMGFKTPFMRVKEWEFEQLFEENNFIITGYFHDATDTTVYIKGELKGLDDTEAPSDEICKELLKALAD